MTTGRDVLQEEVNAREGWGLCALHSGSVEKPNYKRLVNPETGAPDRMGICEDCYSLAQAPDAIQCAIHGLQSKGPAGGCETCERLGAHEVPVGLGVDPAAVKPETYNPASEVGGVPFLKR